MIDQLATEIHQTAVSKGFWAYRDGEDRANQVLAKMMLIDTEVSELADAYVKMRGSEEVTKECADIMIRLLDLVKALEDYGVISHNFEDVLMEKVNYNKTRPVKHDRLM